MKKYILPIIIIVIVIQLAVPIYMIVDKIIVKETGQEFKFRVELFDPYDAFRGRYVAIRCKDVREDFIKTPKRYGIITLDEKGFATIFTTTDKKPNNNSYLKGSNKYSFVNPINRYYMDETLAPLAENTLRNFNTNDIFNNKNDAYITVKIKNGDFVVTGLYINGDRIEKIVENSMNK